MLAEGFEDRVRCNGRFDAILDVADAEACGRRNDLGAGRCRPASFPDHGVGNRLRDVGVEKEKFHANAL